MSDGLWHWRYIATPHDFPAGKLGRNKPMSHERLQQYPLTKFSTACVRNNYLAWDYPLRLIVLFKTAFLGSLCMSRGYQH